MFQAESNAVAVRTGGGKGQPSCRRFFCALRRTAGTAGERTAVGKRDRQVERFQTPIAADSYRVWRGSVQLVHGTGTDLTRSATVCIASLQKIVTKVIFLITDEVGGCNNAHPVVTGPVGQ